MVWRGLPFLIRKIPLTSTCTKLILSSHNHLAMTTTPRTMHADSLVKALKDQGTALGELRESLEEFAALQKKHALEFEKLQAKHAKELIAMRFGLSVEDYDKLIESGKKPCGHEDYFCGCPGSEWDETDSDRTGDDYDKDYSSNEDL